MRPTNRIMLLLAGVLLLFPLAVAAENSKDFGEYVIHYNAMATDFLPP